jgi:hypothetical protein
METVAILVFVFGGFGFCEFHLWDLLGSYSLGADD